MHQNGQFGFIKNSQIIRKSMQKIWAVRISYLQIHHWWIPEQKQKPLAAYFSHDVFCRTLKHHMNVLTRSKTLFSFEAVFDKEVWIDLDGIISGL